MINAAIKGHKESIQSLLDKGADANAKDGKGISALLFAAMHEHKECMALLIDKGADVNARDDKGKSALQWAVISGHKECIQLLIDKGADVNHEDDDGKSVFQYIFHLNSDWTQLLIDKGVDVNHNLLLSALNGHRGGHKECIKLLINKGANVNHIDRYGMSALLYVALEGREDCMQVLIDKGANINHRDNDGMSALDWAARNMRNECISLLINNGADVNYKDKSGRLAFLVGAMKEFKDRGSLLKDRNDINHKDDGLTASTSDDMLKLIHAVINGQECLQTLIGKGVNAKDSKGMSVLLYAAMIGHKECMSVLINNGADVNCKNNSGCAALTYSAIIGYSECISLLIEKGADVNHRQLMDMSALQYAASNGHKECMQLLIDKGADVNHIDTSGYSALSWALANGHKECASLLIYKGADVNNKDECGRSALLWAAERGYKECVQLLIDKGADFNHKNCGGESALLCAAEKGYKECVQLLIDKGADVNARDKDGNTAILLLEKDIDLVRLLVSRGAYLEKGKADKLIQDNPDILFDSPLPLVQCISPATVLKALYGSNKLSSAILRYLSTNDPTTLYRFLMYQHGLLLATDGNLFEEADLNERSSQMNNVLTELFKCEQLDSMDSMLQLLVPHIDFKGYDKKETDFDSYCSSIERFFLQQIENEQKRFIAINAAHCIKYTTGMCVLHYCIKHRLKHIFQFSQISGIVATVFYSTIAPSHLRIKRHIVYYNKLFYLDAPSASFRNGSGSLTECLFKGLNYMINYYTMFDRTSIAVNERYFAIMEMYKNGRYCPVYMFVLEAVSKLITITLVSYMCVHYDANDESVMIARVSLMVMVVGNVVYELGQLQEISFNAASYLDSWNLLDISSIVLLLIWMSLLHHSEYEHVGRLCLCLSSIPLCLSLLQTFSVIKVIGQLIIIIIAMLSDIVSFFIVYIICTIGFTISLTGLSKMISTPHLDDNGYETSFSSVIGSFLFLYSGTLGSFDIFDEQGSPVENLMTFLLTIYLLASSVLLLNLLIARMANTHQRINDAAMQEWSFFIAQTVQHHILIKEKSPLCMLPSPLNLITTAVAPLHYLLMRQGVSLAGSIADKMLVIPGQIQSYLFLLYLYFTNMHKLMEDSNYVLVVLSLLPMVCLFNIILVLTLILIPILPTVNVPCTSHYTCHDSDCQRID